jgi:hypothetical protein
VRILMTRWFRRFVRRERLTEAALRDAVVRAVRGQIDADLGGGVIYRELAKAYLALADRVIDKYVADGILAEISNDE